MSGILAHHAVRQDRSMPPSPRSEAEVARELADLRRHLEASPPHHGEGRARLEERVRSVERELARLRRRPGSHVEPRRD